jgi:hypothetical protein
MSPATLWSTKLACISYFVNRIHTYPVTKVNKEIETRTCQEILNSNGFHYINIIDRINNKKAKKPVKINRDHENKMKNWFSFIYSGTEVLFITRYLKKQNINITFRTSNTLSKYLMKVFCKSANSELLNKCGVYKMWQLLCHVPGSYRYKFQD